MQIFVLLSGCNVRVLNEKYIQAQHTHAHNEENNNRANPMTYTYIFCLSSLHLIEFGERKRENNAEARITRKRKWFSSLVFLLLNDTSKHSFFPLRIYISLSLRHRLLFLYVPLLELSASLILGNHPSIYISICRQSREQKKSRQRTKHCCLYYE